MERTRDEREVVLKVNENEADEMTIEGFVFSPIKCFLSSVLTLISGSLFLILLTWRSDIKLNCLYKKVRLQEADKVLLKDKFEQIFEEDVIRPSNNTTSGSHSGTTNRSFYFVNKKIKYVWDSSLKMFTKLKTLDSHMKQGDFHKLKQGLYQLTITDRLQEFGENFIKISVPPILHLVVHEALNPFYLFQVYTVVLWSVQFYWKFAIIIALTSVVAISASVWETRRQNRNLRDKMKSESTVIVLRQGEETEVSSVELVPGDVILLPTTGGFNMECDAVLVEGSCVVNESMLTGESIPITKIPIPDDNSEKFKYDMQRQFIVFCGTEVMQGKTSRGNFCKAVVIRTGFMTTKGELVRAILFPPPLDFQFHSDFLKSIYVFLTLGLIGMAYSLSMWISKGGTVEEILLNSLDILTFVVPPILPAALTANNAYAQKRLEKKGIHCLHSKHICLCGGIDVVAFDKTGTLTEGNLDLAGVCETTTGQFSEMLPDPTVLGFDSVLVQAIATCHSLINFKGELTGNPLDVKLFEAIEWELKDQFNAGVNPDYGVQTPTLVSPPKGHRNGGGVKTAPSNLEIAVLKTYPFDSAVQRMTVVTKKKGSPNFVVFIKGAPEKVASLCKPETVPKEFSGVLQSYTRQGLRVIAAATKPLNANLRWTEVDGMSRADLEEKAKFLGLIVMKNSVKEETYPAIKSLHEADIVTVMVTGDNILTAISVGRDCQLIKPDQTVVRVEAEPQQDNLSNPLNLSFTIEEADKPGFVPDPNFIRSLHEKNYVFACEGKTFDLIRSYDRALLDRIVQRGKIFARMLPEQKIDLIECLKDLGRQVIMCGDGCNDCGALKTAHAGISLSMAEASVAAPFTSTNVHIGCVPYLITEGRATMVSAFASFKFGVAFAFTQLIAVLMVFYIGTEPSDNQYLVVDIGLAAVPIIMIGNCGPHHTLVKQKPNRHLLSFLPLFSVISYLFFQAFCYAGVWMYLHTQPWFEEYVFVPGLWPPAPSYEQTNIFLLSCAASIIGAIVFSKGAPYRKPFYTNGIMGLWAIAAVATLIFLSLFNSEDFCSRMNFRVAPSLTYQLTILGVMLGNFIFCYIWENFILDGIFFARILPWYKKTIRGPHLPFERLEEELKGNWLPMGDSKNNEVKIAISTKTSGLMSDQQTQTSLPTAVVLREQLKNASRNIKNRWSGGGTQHTSSVGTSTSLVNGGSGGGDEEQALLPASESPFDSPAHRVGRKCEEPPDYSTAALSSKNILVDTLHSNFRPTSTELQRAINQSIFSPKRPDNSEKKETVC